MTPSANSFTKRWIPLSVSMSAPYALFENARICRRTYMIAAAGTRIALPSLDAKTLASVPAMAPQELWQALHTPTPPAVVDVREPREFQRGHVPGAISCHSRTLLSSLNGAPGAGAGRSEWAAGGPSADLGVPRRQTQPACRRLAASRGTTESRCCRAGCWPGVQLDCWRLWTKLRSVSAQVGSRSGSGRGCDRSCLSHDRAASRSNA